MKRTIVRNVLTGEEYTYVNDSGLVENMVNQIIYQTKRTSNLLNEQLRQQIKDEHKLSVHHSTINDKPFVFCQEFDLIARFID